MWSRAIFRTRSSQPSEQSFTLCPFHCKPRPSEVSLESWRLENTPQVPRNRAKVCRNHDARVAVSRTFALLKESGAVFRPRSSKPIVRSFYLFPLHCKPSSSEISLESLGLENIPQVPGKSATVAQNHDARKAVLATLSVLTLNGVIFRPKSSKRGVQKVLLWVLWKPTPSGVSLESPGLENIPKVPGNRAEICQNHHARKAVSAIFSVLMWSGAIFRPRSSKPSVRSFYFCPFNCKPRPLGVSSESTRLENIPQVAGNRAAVGQNHDARKAVSAIF